MSGAGAVIRWEWRGRPLCAYAAGGAPSERRETLSLFPRSSRKRRLLYDAMRFSAGMGIDRWVMPVADPLDGLLSREECHGLVERLRGMYEGARVEWLITWPAMLSRERLYVLYRVPAMAVAGVVKIGAGAFNARQLSNEATVLERLADGAHPFGVPAVRIKAEWPDHRTVLALDGFARDHRACSLDEAREAADAVCAHLPSIPVPKARLRLAETAWFPHQEATGLGDEEFEAVFAHGDLGPGNLDRAPDGRVLLYDWENASLEAPRATDRVGFWLALRQRGVLRAPLAERDRLKQDHGDLGDRDLRLALCFLAAHDNLAARRLLEAWA